jgi:NAD(P)-dependent dehydrogenase (short-subunit alcohol dehydrogenase family)
MAKKWTGKVAIITGAAGGLGKALALEMAARGCHVVLADIDAGLLQETASEMCEAGARLDAKAVDVRDPAQVADLVEGTHRELGRIDYLFNNAGINLCAELRDTSLEDWNRLIDVNLRGVVHGVHAAYPIMREQGFGHMVNTASAAGLVPAAGEGAYSATKHAVVGLSSALRIEAEAFGIEVSVVCPGLIDTPILQSTKYVKLDPQSLVAVTPQKPMGARRAARAILRGVERGDFFIVVTATAHAIWRIHRYAPNTSIRLGRLAIDKLRTMRLEPE